MMEAPGFVSLLETPAGLLAGNNLKPEAVSCDFDNCVDCHDCVENDTDCDSDKDGDPD